MILFLKNTYNALYNQICNLSWDEVYALSQDRDWRSFIGYINAYIFIMQEMSKERAFEMKRCIKHLNHSIQLLTLLKIAGEKAVSAVKSELFNAGLFTEAQNIELMKDYLAQTYSGKPKLFYDIICAIDTTANILTQKITVSHNYPSILEIGKMQINKGFDIYK